VTFLFYFKIGFIEKISRITKKEFESLRVQKFSHQKKKKNVNDKYTKTTR